MDKPKEGYEFSWRRVSKRIVVEAKYHNPKTRICESIGIFSTLKDALEEIKKHKKSHLSSDLNKR